MRIYAVAGNPVLHSKSPFIYNGLFRRANIEAAYTRISARSAAEVLHLAKSIGVDGLNVTSPFKEEMLKFVDESEPQAEILDAVNTIVFRDRTTRGWNTDSKGVTGMLRHNAVEVAGREATVLGVGGAGRAAVAALRSLGATVTVANRTMEKAERLAGSLGCRFCGLEELPVLLENADLLFSCLPRGVDVIDSRWLRPGMTVIDANYSSSALLEHARQQKCRIVSSLDWLIYQALEAFKVYTGLEASYEQAVASVVQSQVPDRKKRSVALIGMMGCGKTTVGQAVARALRRTFVDTDQIVETRTGKTISSIFAESGEPAFRRIEADVVADTVTTDNAVIALGGGALLAEGNRKLIAENCQCVWLWLGTNTVLARTAGSDRPLLSGGNAPDRIGWILQNRIPLYAASADLVIDAERPIEHIVERITNEIRQAN